MMDVKVKKSTGAASPPNFWDVWVDGKVADTRSSKTTAEKIADLIRQGYSPAEARTIIAPFCIHGRYRHKRGRPLRPVTIKGVTVYITDYGFADTSGTSSLRGNKIYVCKWRDPESFNQYIEKTVCAKDKRELVKELRGMIFVDNLRRRKKR